MLNRIDPALFEACFTNWALSLRPDAPDRIALDGKTVRRSGDETSGLRPIHLMSAWASTQRLVLAQEAVGTKANECAAIPALLDRLSVKGALVTIDAIATNPAMAKANTDKGGDYLLALKRKQPTLHDEVAAYFADPATVTSLDKDHGLIETRTTTVSHDVAWLTGDSRHPGEHRFVGLASLMCATTQVERGGKTTTQTRYSIASTHLTPERAAHAIGHHWGIESLHWVLDVVFNENQSRLRRGHGAQNMALVRRLAFNMVRAGKGKRSIKTTQKAAGWGTDTLQDIVSATAR